MSCKSMVVYTSALVLTGVVLTLAMVHGSFAAEKGMYQNIAARMVHLTEAHEQGQISAAEYQRLRRNIKGVVQHGRLC